MANMLQANVIGPSAADYNQRQQQINQGAIGQFAQLRQVDLAARRKAFLDLAEANGVTPALMLATPEGEAAARAILGNDFFGMIGPNKARWEAFLNMPMSEADWANFASLEFKKGNLTPPTPAPAPVVPPPPSGEGSGLEKGQASAPTPASTPKLTYKLEQAPGVPRFAAAGSQPSGDIADITTPGAYSLTTSDGATLFSGSSATEIAAKAQAANRIAQNMGKPEDFTLLKLTPGPQAVTQAKAIVDKYRAAGYDPYSMESSPGMKYAESVDSTDQGFDSKKAVVSSDTNPDGTLKWSKVADQATADALEKQFRAALVKQFPAQADVIARTSLDVLRQRNPATYKAVYSASAGQAPGVGAGARSELASQPAERTVTTPSMPWASPDAFAPPPLWDSQRQVANLPADRQLQIGNTTYRVDAAGYFMKYDDASKGWIRETDPTTIKALQRKESAMEKKAGIQTTYEEGPRGSSPILDMIRSEKPIEITTKVPEERKLVAQATKQATEVGRAAGKEWAVSPGIRDAAYQANLETAARMLNMVDPRTGNIVDNPMVAQAVLNFTKQRYDKVATDMRHLTNGDMLRAAELEAELAASTILAEMSNSQRTKSILEPLMGQFKVLYESRVNELSKKHKGDSKKITEELTQDAAFVAFEKTISEALAAAHGGNVAVTTVWNKDKVGVLGKLVGMMGKQVYAGSALDFLGTGSTGISQDELTRAILGESGGTY